MKIVIIDDNEDLCEILSQALSMRGHVPYVAHEGDKGLALIIETLPDAVICDIGLPGMDGRTIAKTIRAANRRLARLPMVAVSGFNSEADKQKSAAAGFDYLLSKPVSLQDFYVVLSKIEESLAPT